jgi:hypothetical protein
MTHKKNPSRLDREIEEALHRPAGSISTAGDLSLRQRALLRDLRRAKHYHHPLSVEISRDDVARQLAHLGLLRIEPDTDLGLTWVTVTDVGREIALEGGLWGRVGQPHVP